MLKKKIFVFILLCLSLTAFGKDKEISESEQIKDVIEITISEYHNVVEDKLGVDFEPYREQTGERHAALWNTFDNITELRGEYPSLIAAGLAGDSIKITADRRLLDAIYKEEWKGRKIEEYGSVVYEESKEEKFIFEDTERIYEKINISTPEQILKKEIEYRYTPEYDILNNYASEHGKYRVYSHKIGENYPNTEEIFVDKKGEYFNGFMDGMWEFKDMAGNVEKQEYLNDRKHGKYINEKNQIFQYVNGFKHGKWIEIENGITKEILYEYGKPVQEKIIKGAK